MPTPSNTLTAAQPLRLVEATPKHAYQVTLNQQQKLQWQDPESGETHQKEPEAGFWKRLTVKLLSVLPIEGLL